MAMTCIVEAIAYLLGGIGLIAFGWWQVWFNDCRLWRVLVGVVIVFVGWAPLMLGFSMLAR